MRILWDKVTDLRKKVTAALRIRPSDSKEKDFNLALADYLYKELKAEGLPVSKNNVAIKVQLDKAYQEKYNNIIIDCYAGKMYLRGKEISDKYFGRLRRFEGSHASDAYHCVAQSATRIINRIKKIMSADNMEVLGEVSDKVERIDLRKKKTTLIDLRRKAVLGQRKDMRKVASLHDMHKQRSIIDVRDHRTVFSWIQNRRVVASGYDDRIKKVIERIDLRNKSLLK